MNGLLQLENSVNQEIALKHNADVQLFIKREDRIHPQISGNKYRKLKYNLEKAQALGLKTLLTFGGAYSNHVAAVASVGKEFGLNTIGVIRGEELIDKIEENPTLDFAKRCGMHLNFVSRERYKDKASESVLEELRTQFGNYYLIPEGGTNALAIKGCEEILTKEDQHFDYICVAVGTGGTISGLINSASPNQKVLGFPALKGDFLTEDIRKFAKQQNWTLVNDYHFGGYAKINKELVTFINEFKEDYDIPLDPIYTGKMMFGIVDMIKKGKFPRASKILAMHTGGLQGISGMNIVLKKKRMPLLK